MDEYRLGGLLLRWDDGGFPLLGGGNMERFRYSGGPVSAVITLRGRIAPLGPLLQRPCLQRGEVFDRYGLEGEPLLVYHWGHLRDGFAVLPGRIGPEGGAACLFDPEMRRQVPLPADWFFGVSGLHRALLYHQAPILHAAFIEWKGRAILFTAPSQTGKSTQAELWHRYAGAGIVNGDRVLLRREASGWLACGYPCCGSSGVCLDRTLPLGAIVVLEQGQEDRVEKPAEAKTVTALAAGMQIYPWERQEVDRAFQAAVDLASEIPVVKLVCTPTRKAVEALRAYLEVTWCDDSL